MSAERGKISDWVSSFDRNISIVRTDARWAIYISDN